MKKGFTLVELLAVIIILGVIIAIVVPVTNGIINNSKRSAYETQIDKLIEEASKFSIGGNLGVENNVYKIIEFQDLMSAGYIGELPLNPMTDELLKGCILYSYKDSIKQYEFLYDENCDPTDLNQSDSGFDIVVSGNMVNGWYNTDTNVSIDTDGSDVKFCLSNDGCNPNVSDSNFEITTSGVYTVCASAVINGEYNSKCEVIKVDKSDIILEVKQENIFLEYGTDIAIVDFLNVVYGPSGGNLVCDYDNVRQLSGGSNNVNCTATSNSGIVKNKVVNIEIKEPNLMISGEDFQSKIGSYRSTIKEVNFSDSFSGKYDTATIKWDFSKNNNEVVLGYIEEINGKQVLNIEADGEIIAHEKTGGYCFGGTRKSIFCEFKLVESISFNDNFNTSYIKDMSYMFMYTESLKTLDVSSFNTSSVTDMTATFSAITSLENLDLSNFNTSNVTNMAGMFGGSISLESLNVSSFDTSNTLLMVGMFSELNNLKTLDVSSFDTSKVILMGTMFEGLSSLESLNLSNFSTSNVISMGGMFMAASKITNLDLSSFDTSGVSDMEHMFNGMSSLTSLNVSSFDTSSVTKMNYMFRGTTSLVNLDLSSFDTSNVSNTAYMFNNASLLTNAYARTQVDANKFNSSSGKAGNVNFIVKP